MKLIQFFDKLEDHKIYYKPNQGNGGDALIAAGAFELFKTKDLNVEIITGDDYSYLKGKTVMYAGGGNLVKEYNNCADFIEKVHRSVKKLVVLPHTVNGHEDLLKSLKSNVTIFCREQVSYDNLMKGDYNFNLFLDHDLAFHIDVHQYDLFKWISRASVLNMKLEIKNRLSSNKCSVLNAFRMDVEKTEIEIPNNNIDVSMQINHSSRMESRQVVQKTVRDIFQFLNRFEIINTNRLHIAIAAALLDKKVNMYGNSYYKNRAIYEYSILNRYPKVTFCG